MMEFSVLGAGVAGLCCATVLAERGHEVEVIDTDPAPRGASWYAGGMLAPFCEAEIAPPEVLRLGRGAVDWWSARVPGVVRRGTLVVAPARDRAELARFAARTEGHRRLERDAIAGLEPDLAGRFDAALFFSGEAFLDPRRAMKALAENLRARGVPLLLGCDAHPHGRVIDCRGLAARDALPDLRAVRGEMVMVRTQEVALTRTIRLLHPRFPVYVVPRGEGRFLVGATMIETDDDGPITTRATVELLSALYTLHPAFAEAALIETGAGLRPAFPDNLPAIHHGPDRVFVNGFYRHGFLMAPAMAERLARQVGNRHAPDAMQGVPA